MPAAARPSSARAAMGSSRTMACSATQAVPLSNDFEAMIIVAASATSGTLRWT